jgi:NAD(P)-dependent dehydrogenase (short-subunit alcohol dehydrogenase family)
MTGSPFDVSGQVVIVTGSSRGVGYAIARMFLAHGAHVVINGLDGQETHQAYATLSAELPRATETQLRVAAAPGDVSDPATAQALIDNARTTFGGLSTVVCNAGIDIIKDAVDYTPAEWDRLTRVNLRGSFLPAQAAARHWIDDDDRGGCVIFISSIAGSAGIPGLAPYSATKAALDQLARSLAVEWAADGIRVNAVAPGYVENVMAGVTVHGDSATQERIRRSTPLGRRAALEEVAAPVVFLASPAAAYITGATVAVDGGYTAR